VGALFFASIDIRLRKLKGVLDQIKLGLPVFENDFDDIEAEKNIRVVQHPQPFQRASRDELLFGERHRLTWSAVSGSLAGLDFHKSKHAARAISAHQVDFAAVWGPKVLVENFVSFPAQIASRQAFAHPSKPDIGVFPRLRRRRKSAVEQAQKISDGSDKVHGFGD
jgi:hypothetical protein